jgi:hypothetical protein
MQPQKGISWMKLPVQDISNHPGESLPRELILTDFDPVRGKPRAFRPGKDSADGAAIV